MNTRPRMYVDFDGVLNSLEYNPQLLISKTGFDGWTKTQWSNFPLMTSYRRNRAFQDLALEQVDYVWLTTWHLDPAGVEEATEIVGLPFYDKTFAETEEWTERAKQRRTKFSTLEWMSWKADVVASQHSFEDRFIWIDDEAIPRGFAKAFPHALLIAPSSRLGATEKHVDLIKEWLEINATVTATVTQLSDEEFAQAIQNDLDRLGITREQLEQEAATGFTHDDHRRLWGMIK